MIVMTKPMLVSFVENHTAPPNMLSVSSPASHKVAVSNVHYRVVTTFFPAKSSEFVFTGCAAIFY